MVTEEFYRELFSKNKTFDWILINSQSHIEVFMYFHESLSNSKILRI